MDSIAKIESDKYQKMWEFDSYRERSPGMRFIDTALTKLSPKAGSNIIDLGCGTGRTSKHLSNLGFNVTALDIAKNACNEFDGEFVEACLWEIPEQLEQFNYGVCFDVMEHLPTEMVSAAIENISKHCDVVYFQIANFICHEGDKIGESLHLTVKPADWWVKELNPYFNSVTVDIQPKHHLIVCR